MEIRFHKLFLESKEEIKQKAIELYIKREKEIFLKEAGDKIDLKSYDNYMEDAITERFI